MREKVITMNQDNLDPVVNGEDVVTPTGSQPETTTPEPTDNVNPQGASSLSPEEVAWNDLKGGTQDRIKQVLNERNEAIARAERLEAQTRLQNQYQPQYQAPSIRTPEVVDAVQKLSDVGIATDEKVEKIINQRVGNLIYNYELKDLERKYDGSDGLPRFERTEYEDYIKRNPQYASYQPEDVYQKIYSEEIMDAKYGSRKGVIGQKTNSLRPTATAVRKEILTPEGIEERLQQPDGRKWYAENKGRINNILATTPTSQE